MNAFGHAKLLTLSPPAFAALLALLLVFVIRVSRSTRSLGMGPRPAFLLLFVSLVGSDFNIPIATLGHDATVAERAVEFFPAAYRLSEFAGSGEVVLAVNLGGAVAPTLLSIYLLSRRGIWLRGVVATLLVAIICHALAQPVRGVGVALPIFVAPIIAALIALLLGWRHAPSLAYASGSLGVLIGADLANLEELRGLA